MANFKTHLFVATSASGIMAIGLYHENLIEFLNIPWFVFLGTVGGLLPDIDSDNSRPLRILFNLLATLLAGLTVVTFKEQYSIQLIFIIAGGVFFMVRIPLLAVFKRLTVHRGVFHSLLSAVFFTFCTVYINYILFHSALKFAWMSGLFIGFGCIVHLVLDECYSVDLANIQLKRSFGSAFKLLSLRYWYASLAMFCACVALYIYIPVFPFRHQEALTMVNLVLDTTRSTVEKYFFKLSW